MQYGPTIPYTNGKSAHSLVIQYCRPKQVSLRWCVVSYRPKMFFVNFHITLSSDYEVQEVTNSSCNKLCCVALSNSIYHNFPYTVTYLLIKLQGIQACWYSSNMHTNAHLLCSGSIICFIGQVTDCSMNSGCCCCCCSTAAYLYADRQQVPLW